MESVKEPTSLPHSIQDEAEYDIVMAEWIALCLKDEARTVADEARMSELSPLIKEYEDANVHFNTPDAVDMILFRMEQMGLTRKDLIPMIGSRSRV